MNHLPHLLGGTFRVLIRAPARTPAWLQWTTATVAALALVAALWLAVFSALTRCEPGVRLAQAPSLAADRAGTSGAGGADEQRIMAR